MIAFLMTLSILLAPLQTSQEVKLADLFAWTPYSGSIIFEYTGAATCGGKVLRPGTLDCLVAELKATGLFTDVRVELEPRDDGRVNLHITPSWDPQIDNFLIDEIIFEDFDGIDEGKLRAMLKQKGLSPDVPLMRYSFSAIRKMVKAAAREIYQNNPDKEEWLDEMLARLSLRAKVIAPERVKLVIIRGDRVLCQR